MRTRIKIALTAAVLAGSLSACGAQPQCPQGTFPAGDDGQTICVQQNNGDDDFDSDDD